MTSYGPKRTPGVSTVRVYQSPRPGSVLTRPRLHLTDEASLRRPVRQIPAEVHLDIDDAPVSNGENLGVSKSKTVRIASLIGDEDAIGVGHEVDEVEPLDDLAVRPAPAKVRVPIDPIVEGAREMKVGGKKSLECRTVLRHVRIVRGARNLCVAGRRIRGGLRGHGRVPPLVGAFHARFKPVTPRRTVG